MTFRNSLFAPATLALASFAMPLLCYAGKDSKEIEIQEPTAKRSPWQVSVGAAYRKLGGIEFRTGSYSPTVRAAQFSNGQFSERIGGYADRTYDNGYVFKDGGTGNANSSAPDQTWFWGYNNVSQVSNDALSFNSAGAIARFSSKETEWNDDAEGITPYIEGTYFIEINEKLRVGAALSFMFLAFDSEKTSSNFNASIFNVTDTYNLNGVIPPSAPYANTFDGPGPLIPNIPAKRTLTASGASYINRIQESLDVNLYSLSVGPSIEYTWNKVALVFQTGFVLNIAHTEADFSEALILNNNGKTKTVRRWQSNNSDTDFIPGFYLQGGGGYKLSEQWAVSAFGRYDWSDSLTSNVGPSNYSLDLDGWSVGGKLDYSF